MKAKARKIRTLILTSLCLGVLGVLALSVVFGFEPSLDGLKSRLQQTFHAQLANETSHPLRVTEYRWLHKVPPRQSAEQADIYDPDSLMIDRPTLINGAIYKAGVFRFCDFVSLAVRQRADGLDEVTISGGAPLCRMLGDFGHFNSIREAFPVGPGYRP